MAKSNSQSGSGFLARPSMGKSTPIHTLLLYSLAMIVVPVGGFFISRSYLFEGNWLLATCS